MPNTIDSNATGLRYAEESSIGELAGGDVWRPLEPNSYNDFGGKISTVARNPLNASRQRSKGVTTDLEATGGFAHDLTQKGLTRLFQAFLFADIREKPTNIPLNGAGIAFSGVTAADDTYTLASGTIGSQFALGDLVLAAGFSQPANNGVKKVASSTGTTIVVGDGLVDETPAATAKLQKVGHEFASATLDVDVTGTYPKLKRASGVVDFTTFGLIPGEFIFIGGDSAGTKFSTLANNGWARVRSVAASYIELDKTQGTMSAETGTGKTIRVFFGNVIKNESDPTLIKRRSFHLERTLGTDDDGVMSEYLKGAVPNELSIQIRQADKVTVEMGFIAIDHEQRAGSVGVKAGTRPDVETSEAFNTSSDFSRLKMHLVTTDTNPDALYGFLTEATITVNNNVSPNKAIAVLGAFDVSVGQFNVAGNVTAYFSDVAAVQAVRNNSDVAMDLALVKDNAGWVIDLPLIALGEGRLAVEQDKPITLPLSLDAARGSNDHTLLMNEFPYLPNFATA